MLYSTFKDFMIAATIRALPKVREKRSIPDNVYNLVKDILDKGWSVFVTVCALLALGIVAFVAAIAAFISTPVGIIVVAVLAAAGYGAYEGLKLLYRYRWFPLAIWRTGQEVKPDYERKCNDDSEIRTLLANTIDKIVSRS